MSTTPSTLKEMFASLKKAFPSSSIEWRLGTMNNDKSRGRALPYLTFQAVADRLDEVVGEENWKAEYVAGPAGGVVCKLALRINGEWIVKENGAGNTEMEGIKGGLTDAFKRAATMWGVGRYLHAYNALWVEVDSQKTFQAPALPDDLLPPEEVEANRKAAEALAAELAEKAAAAPAPAPATPATEKVEIAKPEKVAKPAAQEKKPAVPESPAEPSTAAPAPAENDAFAQAVAAEVAETVKVPETSEASSVAADTAAPASTEPAGEGKVSTSAASSAEVVIGENGLPVMPQGLADEQLKRVDGLVQRILKGVPSNVIREYVTTGKGVPVMVQEARDYILLCLDHLEKTAATA
jgi:hypothetical protein